MILVRLESSEDLHQLIDRVAFLAKREVLHTILSDIGIDTLEALIEKARENQRNMGHCDYTSVAEEWLKLRRKTMALIVSNNQATLNPFRSGSKLHDIFNFLSDGAVRSLNAITEAGYFPGASGNPVYRRRTSSALRTIRANLERRNVGTVAHFNEGYKIVIR